MRRRKTYKPRKNTSSNPKVGRVVVNRQRTTYGILHPSGKIIYWISAKESATSRYMQEYKQYDRIFGVRMGSIRLL